MSQNSTRNNGHCGCYVISSTSRNFYRPSRHHRSWTSGIFATRLDRRFVNGLRDSVTPVENSEFSFECTKVRAPRDGIIEEFVDRYTTVEFIWNASDLLFIPSGIIDAACRAFPWNNVLREIFIVYGAKVWTNKYIKIDAARMAV